MMMQPTFFSVLLLATPAACAALDGDPAELGSESREAINGGEAFRRVVMTRIYQHDRWMLPAAEGYRAAEFPDHVDQKIAYVCDKLAELKPSYVSGLLRYDALEQVSADSDQVRVFHGVRACLESKITDKKIRFDVVLNAIHYTKPQAMEGKPKYSTKKQAARALKDRLGQIDAILQPDIVFFDFYSVPFHHSNWFPDALLEGIRWIHQDAQHIKYVGGNVWGMNAPQGSDFVALDNFDRKHLIGFEFVKKQAKKLGEKYPVLMHLENNPTKREGKGTRWTMLGRNYRRDVLAEHASSQNKVNYWYMYPVFFPLCIDTNGDHVCECVKPPSGDDRRCSGRPNMAYDAFADVDAGGGNPMSDKIKEYLASETNH
jgi:hypothetical protein